MEGVLQDLIFALRTLKRHPGFAAVVIVTLSLGLGGVTTAFSIVHALLLKPLPYDKPEQLVWIWEANAISNIEEEPTSLPNFFDWRDQSSSFEEMAGFYTWLPTLTNAGEPEVLTATRTTQSFFSVLRSRPVLGRAFLAEEDKPGKNGVAVLGYGLWQQRFSRDEAIIGRSITLDNMPFTVVGVMPASFQSPVPEGNPAQLWVPLGFGPTQAQRRQDFLSVIARLKDGVSIERARRDMNTITSRLAQEYPKTNAGWGMTMIPLHERFVGNNRTAMLLLMASVGLLLLIACANVANLLLVRSMSRRREVALRAALGASKGRLVRQFLTESALLAFLGGVLGTLLAALAIRLLRALGPSSIVRIGEADLSLPVLGFAAFIVLLTGVIVGLISVTRLSDTEVNESLKEGTRGSTEGKRGQRIRSVLGLLEIATALVLLVCSGLMTKSFIRLERVNPGFDPGKLLSAHIRLARYRYGSPYQAVSIFDRIVSDFATVPGVRSVALVTTLPLTGRAPMYNVNIEGGPPLASGQVTDAELQVVSASYFETMDIPVVRGRLFTDGDYEGSAPVVIVSEEMAQRYWPNGDPVGKRLAVDEIRSGAGLTIVGVVGNVRHVSLNAAPYPQMYVTYKQVPRLATSLLVRATSGVTSLSASLRDRLKSVDEELPLHDIRSMSDVLSESISRPRFSTQMITSLAAIALLLTSVGVYGVISYSVSRRTQDIGVRMALGATQGRVMLMILSECLKLALAGIVLGLLLAFILTRLISSLLYEISATDPVTFIAVPLIICAVVVVACYIPARRAARVDPIVALRHE